MNIVVESEKETSIVEDVDVAVAGGGIAGVAAAVAAAGAVEGLMAAAGTGVFSLTAGEALVFGLLAGAGVGRLTGVLASNFTVNRSGPIFN